MSVQEARADEPVASATDEVDKAAEPEEAMPAASDEEVTAPEMPEIASADEGEGVEAPAESAGASDAVPSASYSAVEEAAVAGDALDGESVRTDDAVGESEIADVGEAAYVPGQIVVMYEEDASARDHAAVATLFGADVDVPTVSSGCGDVALVGIEDGTTVKEAVEKARAEEAVKYAVPNYLAVSYGKDGTELEANAAPAASVKDSGSQYQWYLDAIRASQAWQALPNYSAAPVKVAILDTGASLSHPDLKNMVNGSLSKEVVWQSKNPPRYSLRPLRGDGYTNGSSNIEIPSTHGTHVAGIIGAQANNGGILGVASGGTTANANKLVQLVPVDIFSENVTISGKLQPNATLYDVVAGLDHASSAGCSVVNLSLGFLESGDDLADIMNELCTEFSRVDDMVLVCAAGNSGVSSPTYPAACKDAVGVISTDRANIRSDFSNYGSWCDLSAPGEDIYSTIVRENGANDYGSMSGTSMATPVVTATAAMVRAANPDLSAKEVGALLCSTARDIYGAGKDSESGYGVVDAGKAVQEAVRLNTNVWKTIGGKKYYYGANGQPVKWSQKIGGSWYYFNGSGVMQTGWITWKDGTKSYFDWDGRALLGWRSFNGVKYYFDQSTGISKRWSQKIDGKWYYFDSSSRMKKGWVTWGDGTKSYFDPDSKGHAAALLGWRSFNGVKYYFDPATGISKRWSQKIDGQWYYFDGKSVMQKGWVTWKDGTKSYFHPDAKGHAAALLGWRSFNGVKYYFDPATGISKRWSQKIDGKEYYFDSSSRMHKGWITWKNGTKSYFKVNGSGYAPMVTGWQTIGSYQYYFDGAGIMARSKWIGDRYVDSNGRWVRSGSSGSNNVQSKTVYWVDGGSVYHTTKDCASLKRSSNIRSGTIAQSGKSRACNLCG